MSINRVNLTGNLTRDSELRTTASGTNVLSFTIAVNDRHENKETHKWEDVPNFVDCVMFGNRAKALSEYLLKGVKIAVEGKLSYSSWEKDGKHYSRLEVISNEIELMARPVERRQQIISDPELYIEPQPTQTTIYDDDIPF